MEIIDPHVHVWTTADAKYPFAKETTNKPTADALPDTLLTLMKDNGVSKTVLVQVIYYRWDNNYVADVRSRHPKEFMAVGRVNPADAHAADSLDYWTKERGLRGVRLSPGLAPEGDWIANRELMDPIWKRAATLKVPMCVLCPIGQVPAVAKVIERFADLDVCIDHMADCPIGDRAGLDALLSLKRFPRVYLKISHLWSLSKEAFPYKDTHDQLRRIYDAFGRERLMWGTDWPMCQKHCTYAQAVRLYRDEIKFFSDEDRQWILGKTAKKLWPFA
jgi:predicted TIM-barrel fold metal-dependent hydrolase